MSPVSKQTSTQSRAQQSCILRFSLLPTFCPCPSRYALFPGHCIWSSMFEKAALSFSAFLISSALT